MRVRVFGSAAFILLHIILSIGPLCRLDKRFLPLLYNRRHMGVTMCLSAPIVTLLIATAGTVGEKAETAISLCNVLFVGNLCASFVVLGFFGTRSIGDSLRALPGRVRLEMLVFTSLAALLSSMIFTALASFWRKNTFFQKGRRRGGRGPVLHSDTPAAGLGAGWKVGGE